MAHTIEFPYYPIIYVRGYAMRPADIEETFNDTYYGFAASSVYKRQTSAEEGFISPDVFEGQLIRFMKSKFQDGSQKKYGYADSVNTGLNEFEGNPSRSIWVSRFYDRDFIKGSVRTIEDHAKELGDLIINVIPNRLRMYNVSEDSLKNDYKVILIAHSMGGLVCRTLIQNTKFTDIVNIHKGGEEPFELPFERKNPSDLIHRLVTIGTPHKGIDLGNVPDFIEDSIVAALNPYDSSMFKPRRMRKYLSLKDVKMEVNAKSEDLTEEDYKFDLHSLGDSPFPIKRCFCLIGSDYSTYSGVKHVTGSFSDGLVKQDRAYVVSGEKPGEEKYPEDRTAYYANIHRAHSGYCGIVNSLEAFENIQRFIFGDLKFRISLKDLVIHTKLPPKTNSFYDLEFEFSIRGTGVFLHKRKQIPCENALRYSRAEIDALKKEKKDIYLHTGFLNTKLKQPNEKFSYFKIDLNISEYITREGWLWDHQYPSRPIYTESLEIRVLFDELTSQYSAEFSWSSNTDEWEPFAFDDFKQSSTALINKNNDVVTGNLVIAVSSWPDKDLTLD